MTTNAADDVADALRVHAVDLARYDAGLRKQMLRTLTGVERELVAKLAASGVDGNELTAFAQTRLEQLLGNVRGSIATAYGKAHAGVASGLEGLHAVETAVARRAVSAALSVEMSSIVAPQVLRSAVSDVMIQGAPLKEWFARLGGDTAARVQDEIRKGVVSGETNAEIVKRIRGTRANGYKDGVMELPKRSAERVVRTAVQAIANDAQLKTYRANRDTIKGYQHLSTLDGRTSHICISRSGLQWTLDGKPMGEPKHDKRFAVPPLHWNCRSLLTPVLKTFKDLGIDLPELPTGQRASPDGPVAADMTFDEWLKTKDEAFQNELLGKGKADLWRRGKIKLADLSDQSTRPLTLAELQERANRPPVTPRRPPAPRKPKPAPPPPAPPLPPKPVAPPAPPPPPPKPKEPWGRYKLLSEYERHDKYFGPKTPETIRRAIESTRPLARIIEGDPHGSFYGGHLGHGINMDPYKNPLRYGSTWRHEMGHAIDNNGTAAYESMALEKERKAISRKLVTRQNQAPGATGNTYGDMREIENRVRVEPFPAEKTKLVRPYLDEKLKGTGVSADDLMALDSAWQNDKQPAYLLRAAEALKRGDLKSFIDYMWAGANKSDDTYGAGIKLADLFGATTKNKIGFGHTNEYYRLRPHGQMAEAYANYISLVAHGDDAAARAAHNIARALLPDMMGLMDNLTANIVRKRTGFP